MKKLFIIFILLFSTNTYGQNKNVSKSKDFKHPVMVKLIQGQGNVFRIGFIRYNDFYDVKEDASDVSAYYARFLSDAEINNSLFVYFPTSKDNGEMLIVSKITITKMDMTYEQAMQLIIPE